jgi:hypothetical protein
VDFLFAIVKELGKRKREGKKSLRGRAKNEMVDISLLHLWSLFH